MKNKVKLTESIQSKSVEPVCAEFPSNVSEKICEKIHQFVKSIAPHVAFDKVDPGCIQNA